MCILTPPNQQGAIVRQAPVYSEASCGSQRAGGVRAGYDRCAFHEVPITLDSINPISSEQAELVNAHPPGGDRVVSFARKMDGRLDSCAMEVDNANRFRQVAATR